MPKEHTLDQCFRKHRAVDDDEILGCSSAVVVYRPRYQVLAGAGLSGDKNIGVAECGLGQKVQTLLHCRTLPHNPLMLQNDRLWFTTFFLPVSEGPL